MPGTKIILNHHIPFFISKVVAKKNCNRRSCPMDDDVIGITIIIVIMAVN
jgi:hypothetical protein